jgi:hypothetical protein
MLARCFIVKTFQKNRTYGQLCTGQLVHVGKLKATTSITLHLGEHAMITAKAKDKYTMEHCWFSFTETQDLSLSLSLSLSLNLSLCRSVHKHCVSHFNMFGKDAVRTYMVSVHWEFNVIPGAPASAVQSSQQRARRDSAAPEEAVSSSC